MRKVLLFAVALCFMISAQAQNKTNESTENQLKTRVKKVEQLNRQTENFTQMLDSMITSLEMAKATFLYDEKYNLAKVETSFMSGMFVSTIEYFYDNQNRRIRAIETSPTGEKSKVEYSYNNQNWVSEEIHYDFEYSVWQEDNKTVYEYDNNGNVLVATEFDFDDGGWEYDEKVEYTYQGGKLISSMEYSYDNFAWNEHDKSEYQYDNQGDLVEKYEYTKEGNAWVYDGKTVYGYDANHNCVNQKDFDFEYNLQDWVIDEEFHFTYDLSVSSSNIAGLSFFDEAVISLHNKLVTFEDIDYDDGLPEQSTMSTLYYSSLTGIGENSGIQLVIWPNPATETLNLNAKGIQHVEIISMDGKQVMNIEHGFESINVSTLANGCYLLKASFNDGSKAVQKFMKE